MLLDNDLENYNSNNGMSSSLGVIFWNDTSERVGEEGVHGTHLKEGGRGLLSLSFGYQTQLVILLKPRSHGVSRARMLC